MPLASTSLAVVRYIKEVTYGVTPATGNPTVVRLVGESLDFAISKDTTKQIDGTRMVGSLIPTGANASGGFQAELSYRAFDDMFESTLQSAFVAMGTVGATAPFTATMTATTITASAAPTGNDLLTKLKLGQWFRLSSAGANNGKILRVSNTVAPSTTVITLDANTPAVVSAGESITLQSSRLTHGTTQTSFTMERDNPDIGVQISYKGMTPSKFSLKIDSSALSSLSFDHMGKNALESNVTQMPGTPIAAPTFDIHSGVAGATLAVWMDGAPLAGTFLKTAQIDFDNTLRAQPGIGTLGAVGIGAGTIQCSFTAEIYFADKSLFTKFRANTNSSFVISSTDAAGNGYIFTLPVAGLNSYKSNSSAKDSDQMISAVFTALGDYGNADATQRKMIFIDRIGA